VVAVFNPVTDVDGIARQALECYGLPERCRLRMVNHSENTTYRVDDPVSGERLILRVHRPGYHTREAIDSELAWLNTLRRDTDVVTAEPIPGSDGRLVQYSKSAAGGEEGRYCVLFTFLEGSHPSEEALVPAFERLGEVTAKLHAHARGFDVPEGFVRPRWDYEAMLGDTSLWGRWQEGPRMTPASLEVLGTLARTILRRLEAFGDSPEQFGLIHADLRLDNLIMRGREVCVIDFDDAGFGWWLYDLGAALSFIEDREDIDELVAAWVRGYRTQHPLTRDEVDEIPTFIMLRRLLLVAWLGTHADTQIAKSLSGHFTSVSGTLAERYLVRYG